MKANSNGIKKAVSIIILAAGAVLLILAVIDLIVYSEVDSYDSNGLIALICLCGMPGIGLTIVGVRGIKQRNRHNILIAVLGVIAGIAGFVISMASRPPDISNISQSFGVRINIDYYNGTDNHTEETADANTQWYASLDEAAAEGGKPGKCLYHTPLDEETTLAVYAVDDETYLAAVVQCKDGKFASRDSQKKAMDFRGAAGYKFDCDDSIADSIIQLVYERSLAGHDIITDEDGHLIIYGFWDNEEELRSITINHHPLDHIQKTGTDSAYWFWCYCDTDDTIKEAISNIDSSKITCNDIIDGADIWQGVQGKDYLRRQ
ncbi:MAG: hypothetical protein ACOYBC_09485 [Bilifractor sp.]|jgi:hypothetical protein